MSSCSRGLAVLACACARPMAASAATLAAWSIGALMFGPQYQVLAPVAQGTARIQALRLAERRAASACMNA